MSLHNPSRRELLLAALSATAVSAAPSLAWAAAAATAAAPADANFSKLLEDIADEVLRLSPTSATGLGLDKGARAALKSQLEDLSPAGDKAWAEEVKSIQTRLRGINRAALSANAQIRYDTIAYAAESGVQGLRFPFGGAGSGFNGGTAPFPVTQQDGTVTRLPEFLDSQHQIADVADADAYLARLEGMARLLDEETARIAEQAGQGIMPPDFICKTALGQLQDFRKTAAADQKLVTSITERAQKLNLAGDWHARALKLVEGAVYPALDRQIAAFSKAAAKATNVAGVHRLPDGAAYYEWALRLGTSTTHSAKEIHAIGLEQNKQLQARIDAILKKQGISQGSVGQRLLGLTKNPDRFYADDNKGREQLIAFCNERVAAVRKLMPQISHLDMKAPLQIKRVPIDIQDGAPLGYMNFASLDGARPAIYYVNLKSTKLWPKSELSTLTAHEGIPGHAWQGAYLAEHHNELPLISSLIGFNADKKTVVTGVEMFRKLLDEGRAGDNVGLLLRGIGKDEVERGMVLAKPGSITPHTKFTAEVYVLTKEEGGRHTPFFKGYRPQFYFRTTDVTGSVELPEGMEMVMPGDNVQMTIELITPIAMDEGLRFAIREGGRTVGAGVVAKILA